LQDNTYLHGQNHLHWEDILTAPDTHRRACSHRSFCMSFLFYSESSHRGLDKTMKECANIL